MIGMNVVAAHSDGHAQYRRRHELGHALASALGRIFAPRRARRHAILSTPFPRAWKEFLDTRSHHYHRLPVAYRAEFDQQTQIFLAEKRITGIETQVNGEVKLLVAASAVMLTVDGHHGAGRRTAAARRF
jgi:glucose-regulated metallopeptidase M90